MTTKPPTREVYLGIEMPLPATLAKYGLGHGPAALGATAEDDWRALIAETGGTCGACGRVPKSGRLNLDHSHVRGFKDMAPERRRLFLRGVLCYLDNSKRLSRGATVEGLRGAANYLERYELRLAKHLLGEASNRTRKHSLSTLHPTGGDSLAGPRCSSVRAGVTARVRPCQHSVRAGLQDRSR